MKKAFKDTVILEDLDALERRRLEGGKELSGTVGDPRAKRRLLSFVRPFRGRLLVAVALSLFSAFSATLSLFIFEGVLQPIVSAGEPASPLLVGSAVGRPLAVGGGSLGLGFSLLASLWFLMTAKVKLATACAAFMALALLDNGAKYVQRLTMRTVALSLVENVRSALFDRLMGLSMRFFHANHSAKLLSRITHDLATLGSMLVDVMFTLFTDIFAMLGTLVYLWWRGGSFVVLGLVVAALCFLPVQQIAVRVRRREHKNRKKMGTMFQTLTESLSAQKVVKAFGAEDYERQRFAKINAAYTEGRMKAAMLKARTAPVVEIIGSVGAVLVIWFGGVQAINGRWAPETFMVILFGLTRVVGAIRRVASTNTKLQGGLASADRVATVLYSEAEIRDADDAIALPPIREKIVFDDVCYAHEPDQPTLSHVHFELFRGQTLALVGPTGAGKSTVGDMLARFYDPGSGGVKIDGIDIRNVTIDSLRHQIAMVTQETVLFQDTVANNIAYAAPDTPIEHIVLAARAAHAHEFITALPDGYDTLIGERGTKLSGGERQRIAIARALLRDAPILILDEATSALDSQAEALVQDALATLKQGRTTLVIAHRLSTVRDADLILVLDKGAVVERGTHDELLAQGGLYAQLYNMQGG